MSVLTRTPAPPGKSSLVRDRSSEETGRISHDTMGHVRELAVEPDPTEARCEGELLDQQGAQRASRARVHVGKASHCQAMSKQGGEPMGSPPRLCFDTMGIT
jgi:hypothetical protein